MYRMILSLAVCLCASEAIAQPIVDSHNFESPFFNTTFGPGGPGTGTGQLEGQTPGTFNGTWLRSGKGLSTAEIQTAVVNTGSQAVKVHRAAGSNDRWGVPVSAYPTTGNRYISIDWSMRVDAVFAPPDTYGPFFGVEAYDESGSALGLLGSLGVDASTGEVLYQAPDTGYFTATGSSVNEGEWNNYMIEMDYMTHEYSYFINGSLLGTAQFVDENNVAGGLNGFTDADISALASAGNAASLAVQGDGYFDNLVVAEGSSAYGTGLLGDYNLDGVVDAADYVEWRKFNIHGTQGYDDWRSNFGAVSGAGAIVAIVPEPSTLILLALATLPALSSRRRKILR
jgi:hypothetical protein